jgi:hypothetical protein
MLLKSFVLFSTTPRCLFTSQGVSKRLDHELANTLGKISKFVAFDGVLQAKAIQSGNSAVEIDTRGGEPAVKTSEVSINMIGSRRDRV